MKASIVLVAACLTCAWAGLSAAQVPHALNYQGRIQVGTTNFEGAGQFKFALVGLRPNAGRQAAAHAQIFNPGGVLFNLVIDDGGAGYVTPPRVTFVDSTGQGARVEAIVSGGAVVNFSYLNLGSNYSSGVTVVIDPPPAFLEDTCWSNDGTSTGGREPASFVSVQVTRGIYAVLLGDTTLSNMTAIGPGVLTHAHTVLRVWFNDGTSGFQQLAPDQPLGASPFALLADRVADGAVTAAQIAPEAVTAGAIASNAVGTAQVVDGSLTDADLSATAAIDAGKIGRGDLQATRLRVGTNHTLTAGAVLATIAGGQEHVVTAVHAAIGGGKANTVAGSYGTVAGGFRNSVSNSYATVTGGNNNTAHALYATVAGGHLNRASGPGTTVGGGDLNAASVDYATVPGGRENIAAGAYSFAAGRRAVAGHPGAFVWADSADEAVSSTGTNQFIVRASGGIWLGTHSHPALTNGQFLQTSTGAYLSAGGAWTDSSARDAKENFVPVAPLEILHRLEQLPITTWNYRAEHDAVRHLGPVAQDFHRAFGLGGDDRHLAALDSAGVALAALQGLHATVKHKEARIAALEDTVAALARRLAHLQAALDATRAHPPTPQAAAPAGSPPPDTP
ncbi:MAG: hypothetical protein JXQ71_04500 [Verrucomicrobia bacterium]|nr:hypothetical protein [Verrucomicrobiota bacterium]